MVAVLGVGKANKLHSFLLLNDKEAIEFIFNVNFDFYF